MKGDNNADRVPLEPARDNRDFLSDLHGGMGSDEVGAVNEEAAAVVLGRAALPKPDCKCGRPYHSGKYYGGVLGQRRCDGYEPITALHPDEQRAALPKPVQPGPWRCEKCGEYVEPDPNTPDGRGHGIRGRGDDPWELCGPISREQDTDIPSSKEHGGQLASLDREQAAAMLRAHRLTRLREALDVCRAEAEERSDYDGEDFGAYLRSTQYAMFAGGVQYLEACIAVLAGEVEG